MKKSTVKFLGVAFLLVTVASMAMADYYVNVFGATTWTRIDYRKFVVYSGSRAIALVELWDYVVYSDSNITFLEDFVSNGDKILVDDRVIEIRKITRIR